MKYFTAEWWEGGCENAEEVFSRYGQHLKNIETLLPTQLLDLDQNHTLHDSEVKKVFCSFSDKTLAIELLGWDINLQFPVRYRLLFSGVERLNQIFPQQDYVESELGDLGYWELDVIDRRVEMSMLFVSGAEFSIVFEGFEFSYEAANV